MTLISRLYTSISLPTFSLVLSSRAPPSFLSTASPPPLPFLPLALARGLTSLARLRAG